MIVACTKQIVDELIQYCQNGQMVNLIVQKDGDKFLAQYGLLDEISDESVKTAIQKCKERSLKTTCDLISKLRILKKLMEVDISKVSFTLKYDCLNIGTNKLPVFLYSEVIPAGLIDRRVLLEQKQPQVVDWNEVFSDKLDETVPNLYTKKAQKKYATITYRELVKILQKG